MDRSCNEMLRFFGVTLARSDGGYGSQSFVMGQSASAFWDGLMRFFGQIGESVFWSRCEIKGEHGPGLFHFLGL